VLAQVQVQVQVLALVAVLVQVLVLVPVLMMFVSLHDPCCGCVGEAAADFAVTLGQRRRGSCGLHVAKTAVTSSKRPLWKNESQGWCTAFRNRKDYPKRFFHVGSANIY
jgi:hypothetical protein